jgi:hypothetical protein
MSERTCLLLAGRTGSPGLHDWVVNDSGVAADCTGRPLEINGLFVGIRDQESGIRAVSGIRK